MWARKFKLVQFLVAISLGFAYQAQAHHDGHHVRWHADGTFHGNPNHWNTISPHHIALQDENDHRWIPLKKRGELLSSHPPNQLIQNRALKCSMFRKISGICPRPPNHVLSGMTGSHHHQKRAEPIDILKHPSHLIARHVTFVKRHSYGHLNHGNDENDDSDDDADADTGDSDEKPEKHSSSGDGDNGDDEQSSKKDESVSSKADGISGSSASRSSGSGGSSKSDQNDDDGDSQGPDDHDGPKSRDSGNQEDTSDNLGKSRNTKDDDASDSNENHDTSSGDLNSDSGYGNDHHNSWTPSPSATPTSTYENSQPTPDASENASTDSSTHTSKDSDDFSSSKTTTSQKHHPTSSSFNEGSKDHSSKLAPRPTAHPTYTHSQGANNDTDVDEDPEDQCTIVTKIYEELGGTNWDNQEGWTNSSSQTEQGSGDCCGNFGLNCDPQDRIVSIDLASNGLVGGIPSAIFGLGSLIRLNLSSNSLVGPLPDKFQKLQNLTTILLNSTGLGDELPISLQQLPNLVSVHLSNNSFSGNVSFSVATGLAQLDLSRNKFSGTINFSTNANIEKLVLDDNLFTGQLPDLATLPKLQIMSIARNQFSGPPPNLAQPPPGLIRLDIQSNSLVGPFLDPINATSLQTLSMKGNTYTGSFPSSQAPPALTFCQLDHIPNSSCPPANILNQDNSLAKKCQLVCGKRGGVPNIGRENPKEASNASPKNVSSSAYSLVTPKTTLLVILVLCMYAVV